MAYASKHWRRLPIAGLEGLMLAEGRPLTLTDHQRMARMQRRLAKLRRRQRKTGDLTAAGITEA